MRNWLIGYYIVEFEQKGKERAQYGDKLLKRLEDAVNQKGLTVTLFQWARRFYTLYPQIEKLFYVSGPADIQKYASVMPKFISSADDIISKLSFTHLREIMSLDEDWEFEGSHRRQSTDVFRMSGKSPKKIKLRLGLRAKNLLLEEYPLAAKDIIRKGAYWILETGVFDYAGVCRFYCGLADDIEILGSPELEAYVQEYAREHIIR